MGGTRRQNVIRALNSKSPATLELSQNFESLMLATVMCRFASNLLIKYSKCVKYSKLVQ